MASLIERGLFSLILQFTLFGLIILINQLTLDCDRSLCGYFPTGWRIAGGVIFFPCMIVWAWGMATLGDNLTMFPMPLEGAPLKKDGPYAYVRHPSYIGLSGMFIFGSFAFGSPVGAIVAALTLPTFFSFKAAEEERNMATLHGEDWLTYKASTPPGCVICNNGGTAGTQTGRV